ncbi:hypothetical protein COB21_05345 [Candidatus Aerophobetes bacterium]|uniref:assimilatory sulfite reductase (NADPH) n=1 Tax=Aerophobetes bacterium TaxID=2030807 RepID=A0A2A4X087_UNCAE|nr:MAG: hypothetical protein COB21_05345 [Candidatus Aerophobetes bacterium]
MSYCKDKPFISRIIQRDRLDKPGSTKPTFHLHLDITGSGISYTPGDSLAILPSHSSARVETLLDALSIPGTTIVHLERKGITTTLSKALKYHINLSKLPKKALLAFAERHSNDEIKEDILSLCRSSTKIQEDKRFASLDAFISTFKMPLDLLNPFLNALLPLLPRFYSIASSQKQNPNQIDLLIAPIHYRSENLSIKGVASDFLCESACLETTPIPIFLVPNTHFSLPQDPNTPLIMIGPGTGIAPFRAFLQERFSINAKGENYLFFGDRHRAYNYTYQYYMHNLADKGFIKLFTAFSRDQKEKRYVQHLLLEQARHLFEQIESKGAHVYICGDAKFMAKDVKEALMHIFEKEGALPREGAKAYLKSLIRSKRLLLDVY